ncbi:MAG: FecR domain-containing protein [Bacteroidota bacterium]
MSNQNKYPFPDFIANGLAEGGDLSEKDIKAVESILAKSSGYAYPDARTGANWAKLQSRITTDNVIPITQASKRTFPILKWAVAAVIVLGIAVGLWRYNLPEPIQMVAYASENTTKEVLLPDGSVIKMNKQSTIQHNDFNSDERIVELSGEAYFSIVHNGKPFTVKTSQGNVTVLGTEFNIKDRNSDKACFEVTLAKGKIAFQPNGSKPFTMKPGDVIKKIKDGEFELNKIQVNTLGWLEQKLIFENESLENIIKALEEQYSVKFSFDENLKNEKLTLTFSQLTAEQAADLLSKTLKSKVIIK